MGSRFMPLFRSEKGERGRQTRQPHLLDDGDKLAGRRSRLPLPKLELSGVEVVRPWDGQRADGLPGSFKGEKVIVERCFVAAVLATGRETRRHDRSEHPHLCSAGRPWPSADGSEASA